MAQQPALSSQHTLTSNALTVLNKRYLIRDENGVVVETPDDLFWRVATTIAAVDKRYGATDEQVYELACQFYEMMVTRKWLPNSPTLMNAGRPLGQLSACFVLPVADSIANGRDGIYDTLTAMARVHQSGGGTGFSFSRLRPNGAMVRSTTGVASGPVSFMKLYDASTEVVKQGGTRRGANMGILRVDHPNILEFIDCKQDLSQVTNFNISVAVTDAFMAQVEAGLPYELVDPSTGKVVGELDARMVWNKLIENAWRTGEPGVFFIDEANRYNPVPHLGRYEATNPCVTGDTKILTVNGPRSFADLATTGQDVLVFAVNKETNEPVVRWMRAPRMTRRSAEVLEVEFDSGLRVKVTPDHNFVGFYGDKLQAKDLEPGASIAAFRVHEHRDGHLVVSRGVRGTAHETYNRYVHRMVGDALGWPIEGHVLHHKDENRRNNDPVNLELLSDNSTHNSLQYPARFRAGFNGYGEKSETTRQRISQGLRRFYSSREVANHKVVAVREAGVADIYNGTVDDVHTYVIADPQPIGKNTVYSGIVSANCGEQPLLPDDVCTLGSLNLAEFVQAEGVGLAGVDWMELDHYARLSTHFLDNVIDANNYPLPEITDLSKRIRRIGNGVMGFADCLIALGIRYDSDEGVAAGRKFARFFDEACKQESEALARTRGVFPEWGLSIWGPDAMCARNEYGERIRPGRVLRNCNVNTVAPTGTISIIAGCSSGIEPLFAVAFMRNQAETRMADINPLFVAQAKREGWYSPELMDAIAEAGHIHFPEVPEDVQRVFRTANEIAPEWHVRMQAAWQEHTDSAISKTTNFAYTATVDDVRQVYELAYQLKCKGVTVYRDGCRDNQVLSTGATRRAGDTDGIRTRTEPYNAPAPEVTGTVSASLHRPEVVPGRTWKVDYNGEKLYITVNRHPDTDAIIEVFLAHGHAGSDDRAQMEALGRMVSTSLKHGTPIDAVVKQLEGIMGENVAFSNGRKFLSIPDAIGQVLALESHPPTTATGPGTPSSPIGERCPGCGDNGLIRDSGCKKCVLCSYSAC